MKTKKIKAPRATVFEQSEESKLSNKWVGRSGVKIRQPNGRIGSDYTVVYLSNVRVIVESNKNRELRLSFPLAEFLVLNDVTYRKSRI